MLSKGKVVANGSLNVALFWVHMESVSLLCSVSEAGAAMTMDDTHVWLRPTQWFQSISENSSIKVQGRRLTVNCKPESDHDLEIGDRKRIHDFSVHLTILEGEPSTADSERLKRGIGKFAFHGEQSSDQGTIEASISGWFFAKSEHYEEIWKQVCQANYAECRITLEVGPVAHKGFGSAWDVKTSNVIFISSYSVDFIREPPKEKVPEVKPERKGLFRL